MVVWGIGSNETEDLLTSFRDTLGITFPILNDTDGAVHDLYVQQTEFGDSIYPQDWIIGTDGDIAYVNNGYEPDEWVLVLEGELE